MMRILEQRTRAELRAAADSLEALLEGGTPDQQDMLALVSQMRSWGCEVIQAATTMCPPVLELQNLH